MIGFVLLSCLFCEVFCTGCWDVGFHLLSNIYHVSETEIQMESSGSKGSIGYSFLESEKPMKKQTVAFNTGNNFQPGVFRRFGVHL